jgi:hypothetical protein
MSGLASVLTKPAANPTSALNIERRILKISKSSFVIVVSSFTGGANVDVKVPSCGVISASAF